MQAEPDLLLHPIGRVRSSLRSRDAAPHQGAEGAPEAWLDLEPGLEAAAADLRPGQELLLLTWFHLARRDALQVHPRGDRTATLTGVFATRSPDRPNPIGLHRVTLLERRGTALRVAPLEALDGTPVLDLKPALDAQER